MTEIKLYTKQGRPVLVGTTSVERSEALAAMLQQEGGSLPRNSPLALTITQHPYASAQPVAGGT